MATAKRSTGRRASRRWLKGALLVSVLLGAAFWWFRAPILGMAGAGTAYGAHIGCSCRYIGGRDLASCRGDLEGSMWAVFLSEDEDERSVTARVPLVASETAIFREGQGCVLEKWDG